MIRIAEIINFLETVAPLSLQESYDNAGLLTGDPEQPCTGAIISLDVTEAVLAEAIDKNCNLIIAHHPLIFRGLKRISGADPVGRIVIGAIRNDIAVYAIHTNLDNIVDGVNGRLADRLGILGRQVLQPMAYPLRKLSTFVPDAHLETLRQALFEAGAGHVGKYAGCSFVSSGTGSFTAGEGTNPFAGTKGKPHFEAEQKLELIFQAHLEQRVLDALFRTHPYEEVAYDIFRLENSNMSVGSGLVGSFAEPMDERALMDMVSRTCNIPVIRHSPLTGRKVKRIAICGGSGSFLIPKAIAAGVDAFLTADLKYHDFFEPGGRILLADIGHYEGEQFTTALLYDLIREKFHTFAVQKTAFPSNPVNYHQ